MKKTQPAAARTLADVPLRAFVFLHGVAASPEIRAELLEHGYRPEDHEEGWTLLGRVCRHRPATPRRDPSQVAAQEEAERWASSSARFVRVVLNRRWPAHAQHFLAALATGEPKDVTLGIESLLQALESVARRVERGEARAGDREALAALADRGISPAEGARLRALVLRARGEFPPRDAPHVVQPQTPTDAEIDELRAWFVAWSGVAREVLPRRDHRIRLGLARRSASAARRTAGKALH